MDSLTNAVGAVAGASEGFYALVKKFLYLAMLFVTKNAKNKRKKLFMKNF